MEAKISQFADDTTLICRDTDALKENMKVLNDFRDISGLRLNKKKTKAMWIGSNKNNRTKPMGFQSYQEPIKTWGTHLSYDKDRIDHLNFFVKIYKMDAKLNMWQTRDLTLFGRTMLVKALGISKLVYAASMLCVPEVVVKTVQERIFKFLWKNKEDKVKRPVVMQSLYYGGLNFPNFRTVSIFWRNLFERGICSVSDLLDENGKFLSLGNFQLKYNVHLNYLQYFQQKL